MALRLATRPRNARDAAVALLMMMAACGPGVRSEPGTRAGQRDAGEDRTLGADAAGSSAPPAHHDGTQDSHSGGAAGMGGASGPDAGDFAPPPPDAGAFARSWQPCGQLGDAPARDLALTPDGTLAAIAFKDGRIVLYDGVAFTALRTLQGTPQERTALAFSADGSLLAASAGEAVTVWRTSDGAELQHVSTAPDPVAAVAFSAKKDLLLTSGPAAAADGTALDLRARLWRLADGALVQLYGGFPDQPIVAAFAAGGPAVVFVSAHAFHTLAPDGSEVAHAQLAVEVERAVVAPDGAKLGVVAIDRSGGSTSYVVALLNMVDGRQRWLATDTPIGVAGLFFSADSARLVASGENEAMVYSSSGKTVTIFRLQGALARRRIVLGGNSLFFLHSDGRIVRLALADGGELPFVAIPPGHSGRLWALAASRDGRLLASSDVGEAGSTWIWQIADGKPVRRFESAGVDVALDFSPDGTALATGGNPPRVRSVGDGRTLWEFPAADPSTGGLAFVRFSADGKRLIVNGSFTPSVGIFDTIDGHAITHVAGLVAEMGLALSHDGALLATSGPELWRVDDSKPLWRGVPPVPPERMSNVVPMPDNSVDFSPDGATLVVSHTLAEDGQQLPVGATTKLLRVSDGSTVRDLGTRLPRRPRFSADGSHILAGDRILDVAADTIMVLPIAAQVSIFLADGRIAAGAPDGRIRLLCPQP